MTLADDITAALVAGGLATGKGTDVFLYKWETKPANQIYIRPYGGHSIPLIGSADIEFPRLQIQVRNTSLSAAETKILAIKALLHKNTNIANSVICVWDGRAPDYWQDDNERHIFSVEFSVIRR